MRVIYGSHEGTGTGPQQQTPQLQAEIDQTDQRMQELRQQFEQRNRELGLGALYNCRILRDWHHGAPAGYGYGVVV